MQIIGITTTCKNDSIKDAFKKSGYKLRVKKVSWPRLKEPAAVRMEVKTGRAVEFLRSAN